MKVELGGGTRPRPGYVNVDRIESADVVVDLELVGGGTKRLPFDDDSVEAVYSAHCFEHLRIYGGVLIEICRICRRGAPVEIRVPHWGQDMAMCAGHLHTISETQVLHWSEFRNDWFPGHRHLKLERTEYVPSRFFQDAKSLFPALTDVQIFRFIQNTCHEIAFHFRVESD